MTTRHLIVHGRAQGVFYRDWTVATARSLGLAGWVRNLRDSSIEPLAAANELDARPKPPNA